MDGERILFIEFCNFTDYPLGGHLSFAKHLTRAMAGGMDLVGLTTDAEEPVGEWQVKIVEGAEYRVLNVARVVPSSKRPLVPSRVTNYFLMRRFASRIEWGRYPVILIQTPEILFRPQGCAIPCHPCGARCGQSARHIPLSVGAQAGVALRPCLLPPGGQGAQAAGRRRQGGCGRVCGAWPWPDLRRQGAAVSHAL